MSANRTIKRSNVTHRGQTYVVSTIHVPGANYYETCLFSPRRETKVVDQYATQAAANSGHDHWVARVGDSGWPPHTECGECGAAITDGAGANTTVSTQHATSCSLHPDNIAGFELTSDDTAP